jgi:RNA polymerase sigma-70 factor (ECF subfamily)
MSSSPDRPPPRSFEQLYASNFHGLTLQLFAYLGDLDQAQDVVQEAFCRAFDRWRTLRRYDDPVAWVRRVAWNLATSHWRQLRTATNFLRRQRSEPAVAGPGPERVALVHALSQLSATQRRVFVLRYLAGLSVLEIAASEEMPKGTVKSTLYRARTELARHLADERTETSHV